MSEDLRSATQQAVRVRGVEVFEHPKDYLGFLADALPEDSLELSVLYNQCDETWLEVFASAGRAGTESALRDAAMRSEQLLTTQRAVIPSMAQQLSADIVRGMADALELDVSVPELDQNDPSDSPAYENVEWDRIAAEPVPVKHVTRPQTNVRLDDLSQHWQSASTRNRRRMVAVLVVALIGVCVVAWMTVRLSACALVLNPVTIMDNVEPTSDHTPVRVSGDADAKHAPSVISISAKGEGTVGLLEDGTLRATGATEFEDERHVNDISEWQHITAISRGETFILGLRETGKISTMGSNEAGQCNVGTWTDVVSIAGGGEHTIAALSDGTVRATGRNHKGQCDVSEWKNVVLVAAGKNHSLGLHADGTVVATGANAAKQCEVSQWKNVAYLAAGVYHSVGLCEDGTVLSAGSNDKGQCDVSTWTNVRAVAAGADFTVGLKTDGKVVATGDNSAGQCDVQTWTDVVAIAAGNEHTVGLRKDGTLLTTGSNKYGQLNVEDWLQ